jgi:hypothetical protein
MLSRISYQMSRAFAARAVWRVLLVALAVIVVSGRLSTEHAMLATDLYEVGGSKNVPQLTQEAYARVCGLEMW